MEGLHTSNLYPDYVWLIKSQRLGGMPRPPLEDLPQLYKAGIKRNSFSDGRTLGD